MKLKLQKYTFEVKEYFLVNNFKFLEPMTHFIFLPCHQMADYRIPDRKFS